MAACRCTPATLMNAAGMVLLWQSSGTIGLLIVLTVKELTLNEELWQLLVGY